MSNIIDCTSVLPKVIQTQTLPDCEVKPIASHLLHELSSIMVRLKELWIPYSKVNFELPKNADKGYLLVLLKENNTLEYCLGPHLAFLNMYTNDINGIHLYDDLEQKITRINDQITHWLPVPLGGKWL